MVLRSSSVVTLLSNELSWDTLAFLLVVQFGPELDAWCVVVYLFYLGVDWPDLGQAFLAKPRNMAAKCMSLFTIVLLLFVCGIGLE